MKSDEVLDYILAMLGVGANSMISKDLEFGLSC